MIVGPAVWRSGGRMFAAVGLFLSAAPPVRLSAQLEIHLAAGARFTTNLVSDKILTPVSVRPAAAPAVILSVADRPRAGRPWAADAALDLSHGDVMVHDLGALTTRRLTSLTTVAFTVGVRRQVVPGLEARVGVGALKYLPGEDTGIFQDGYGLATLGSLALGFAPRTGALERFGFMLRYDAHRFTTRALRAAGFADPRLVHRLALGVQARLLGPGPEERLPR